MRVLVPQAEFHLMGRRWLREWCLISGAARIWNIFVLCLHWRFRRQQVVRGTRDARPPRTRFGAVGQDGSRAKLRLDFLNTHRVARIRRPGIEMEDLHITFELEKVLR